MYDLSFNILFHFGCLYNLFLNIHICTLLLFVVLHRHCVLILYRLSGWFQCQCFVMTICTILHFHQFSVEFIGICDQSSTILRHNYISYCKALFCGGLISAENENSAKIRPPRKKGFTVHCLDSVRNPMTELKLAFLSCLKGQSIQCRQWD